MSCSRAVRGPPRTAAPRTTSSETGGPTCAPEAPSARLLRGLQLTRQQPPVEQLQGVEVWPASHRLSYRLRRVPGVNQRLDRGYLRSAGLVIGHGQPPQIPAPGSYE